MKVFHTQQTAGMSGKSGQGVFVPSGLQGMSYMRTYTYPTLTPNNSTKGAELKNIKTMYFSAEAAYITDLKLYAKEYANLNNYGKPNAKRADSAFAVFVKLLFAMQQSDPTHINLETATLTDLDLLIPGNTSVYYQCLNGFLPTTPNYATYTSDWT